VLQANAGVITRNDPCILGNKFPEELMVLVINVSDFVDAELTGLVVFILGHCYSI
jgi:hypothetical protein